VPRLLLEASETPYDSVMHFKGTGMKEYAPFGQLPLYHGDELPGTILSESGAISRHIARAVGWAGKDGAEQARADQFFELAKDISGKKAALHDPKHADAGRLAMFLEAAEKHAPANADLPSSKAVSPTSLPRRCVAL
jgi:glutathione S-transferase